MLILELGSLSSDGIHGLTRGDNNEIRGGWEEEEAGMTKGRKLVG